MEYATDPIAAASRDNGDGESARLNPDSMHGAQGSDSCPEAVASATDQGAASSIAAGTSSALIQDSLLEQQETGDSLDEHPEAAAGSVCPTPTSAAKKLTRPRGHRNGRRGMAKSQLVCKVDDCGTVLSSSKAYYQRHRVCAAHLAAMAATVDGVESRFCQQCGKFQPLEEFDNDKRSCRSRLKRHNNRRREQRHSKSMHERSYPHLPSHLDMLAAGSLTSLNPSNLEPQGLADSGLGLNPSSNLTNPTTSQVSPNPSGDNSCSAALRFDASPGTPAAPVSAAAAAAAAAAGIPSSILGGRLAVRRSSASKALEAFKCLHASSNSTASDYDDDGMEEAQQGSPIMAAAAAACKSRRRLNMNAATLITSNLGPDPQGPAGFSNAAQQGLGLGLVHQQSVGPGFNSSLGSVEFAAAVQAAAVGGTYNKCAMSAAGSVGSCDVGFSSGRFNPGLSRFAMLNTISNAGSELGAFARQQQQWGQQLRSSAPYQPGSSATSSGLGAMHPYGGCSSSNAPNATALAEMHSAPPLLHAATSGGGCSEPGLAGKANLAAAGRISDAGVLKGVPVGHLPRHQQQQVLAGMGLTAGAYAEPPASTAVQMQQHDLGSSFGVAVMAGASSSIDGTASLQQQQQHATWQPAATHPKLDSRLPASLQVLAQLRSNSLPTMHTLAPQQQQQQQAFGFGSNPNEHVSEPQITAQYAVAAAGAEHLLAPGPAGPPNARMMPSPFQIAIPPQHTLLGRPYASFSGIERNFLESPCVSLTAPLRQNLAGMELGRSGSFTGWQSAPQHHQQQQQQLRPPRGQTEQYEQRQGAPEVMIKQGSTAYEQLPTQLEQTVGTIDCGGAGNVVEQPGGESPMWIEGITSPGVPLHEPPEQQQQQRRQQGQQGCAHDMAMSPDMERYESIEAQSTQGFTTQDLATGPHYPCTADATQYQAALGGPASQQDASRAAQHFPEPHYGSAQQSFNGLGAPGQRYSGAGGPVASQHRGPEAAAGLQYSAGDAHMAPQQQYTYARGPTGQPYLLRQDSAGQPGLTATQGQTPSTGRLPAQQYSTTASGQDQYDGGNTAGQQYRSYEGPNAEAQNGMGDANLPGTQQQQYHCTEDPTQQHYQQDLPTNPRAAAANSGEYASPNEEVVGQSTAGEYGDNTMMQCMSTDEDFGDLLELLLEGEEAQQG